MKISDLLLRCVTALESIAESLLVIAAKEKAPSWYIGPPSGPFAPTFDPGVPKIPGTQTWPTVSYGPLPTFAVYYGCQVVGKTTSTDGCQVVGKTTSTDGKWSGK